ncbi:MULTISPECIES: sulfurtransferase [unclassified Acidovorax]|uniref:sulfurtransferase n=1 Tax=unclassified Acidovorax TaxID=2684926 RepID=UPI0023DE5363|nr:MULTISPECIES: sulfurtransferase [unclassified Acidovorax]GKS88574.1 sulfurtransferase [Acidovorax sp. SUPP2539]GKS99964.1 sulfurtransferase [Acidovorax sp. SUPP3434]
MPYTTLISAAELQSLIASGAPRMVFDCTFDLTQPSLGEQQYRESHIPGALYAHLDRDLSAKHGAPGAGGTIVATEADQPASGGRHPLPNRDRLEAWLSRIGFTNGMQAVVYDRNGANYCGRLWWMLKWAGHDAVAVLDGGLQAWTAAGGDLASGDEPAHFQSNFKLGEPLRQLATAADVQAALGQDRQTVIDARAPARYRGEVEPLDPVAGHIPGALNRPFSENLGPDGRFKPAAQLRAEFEALLGARAPGTVVHQCGSGVSAIPNVLAMELAGFGKTTLFAGSWSEWCSAPDRPVERG